MLGTHTISTTSRRELSSSFFFFLQGKASKEIHAILIETLACLLSGRAKDFSAPLYYRLVILTSLPTFFTQNVWRDVRQLKALVQFNLP